MPRNPRARWRTSAAGRWQPAAGFRPRGVRISPARLTSLKRSPACTATSASRRACPPSPGRPPRCPRRRSATASASSFAAERECARFAPDCEPVRVLNPLSQESAILRTSSLPSMLRALLENLHHGVGAPKLFEMGKTYQLAGGVPVEPRVLTLGAVGGAVDYARLKGEVEAVLAAFALPALAAERTSHAAFHPGRRARFGNFAHFGQLHPDAAREWKLPSDAWIAEIALEPLYAAGPRAIAYRPPPRYPASERD